MKEKRNRIKYDAQYYKRLVHFFCSRFKNQFRFQELNYRQNGIIFDLLMKNNRIGCCLIKGHDYPDLYFDDYIQVSKVAFNDYIDNIKIQFPNLDNYFGTPITFDVDKDAVVGVLDLNHPDGYNISILETISYFAKELAILKWKIDIIKDQITPQYFLYLNNKNDINIKNIKDFYDLENNIILVDDAETFKHKPVEAVASDASNNLEKLIIHKQELLRELYTFLGFESSQQISKKEHLITDEVEPEVLTSRSYKQIFKDCLQGFGNRVGEVLGLPLTLIVADDLLIQEKLLQDKNNNNFMTAESSTNVSFGAAGVGYSAPSGNGSVSMALKTSVDGLNNDTNNPMGSNTFPALPGQASIVGDVVTPFGNAFNTSGDFKKSKQKEEKDDRNYKEILTGIGTILGSMNLGNQNLNNFVNRHPEYFDPETIRARQNAAAERFEKENFYRLRLEEAMHNQEDHIGTGHEFEEYFFNVGNEVANVFHRFHRDYIARLHNHYTRFYEMDLSVEQVNEIFFDASKILYAQRGESFSINGAYSFNNRFEYQQLKPYHFNMRFNGFYDISNPVREFYEGIIKKYPNLQPWQAEIITYDALSLTDFEIHQFQIELSGQMEKYVGLVMQKPDAIKFLGQENKYNFLTKQRLDDISYIGFAVNKFPNDILEIIQGDAMSVNALTILPSLIGLYHNDMRDFVYERAAEATINLPAIAALVLTGLYYRKELNDLVKGIKVEVKGLYEKLSGLADEKIKFFAEFNQKKYQKFINEEATKIQFEKFMEEEIAAKLTKKTIEDKKKIYFTMLDKRLDILTKEYKEYVNIVGDFQDTYRILKGYRHDAGYYLEDLKQIWRDVKNNFESFDNMIRENFGLATHIVSANGDYYNIYSVSEGKKPLRLPKYQDVINETFMKSYRAQFVIPDTLKLYTKAAKKYIAYMKAENEKRWFHYFDY